MRCMTRGVGMGIIAPALLPRFCRGGGEIRSLAEG